MHTRIACLVMAALVLGPPQPGGAQRDTLELPDSSYLALTLDLPLAGTFQVYRYHYSRSYQVRTLILNETRDVQVLGCQLRWRHTTQSYTEGLSPRRGLHEIQVPLKLLDVDRITVRPALAGAGYRYDPQPYEILGYVRERGTRPIEERNLDNGFVSRHWMFTIRVGEEDAARRLTAALLDAVQRCDTWRTAPMRPIRNPE